jgi:uncharacterized protein YjiS (DUF1127 family)
MARYADHPMARSQRSQTGASARRQAYVRLNFVVQLWHLWRQRSRERRYAAQFTDRDLWDVGLTRWDVYREFSRPFWQADGKRGDP